MKRKAVEKANSDWIHSIGIEDDDEIWCALEEDDLEDEHIRRTSKSTELAEEIAKDKPPQTFEEIVPEPYQDFKKVL